MAGEHDFEGPAQILRLSWETPPIRSHRVVPLGTDGSNFYFLKTNASGELIVSGSGGGGDGAILDGASASIKATVFDYASSNPLAVNLVDTNGDPTSVGGGTQYQEGDTDATIIGTAILWEDTGDTLRAVSAAKPLPVAGIVTANAGVGTFSVAGIVTANAGIGTYQVAGIVTANAGLGTWSVLGTVTSTIAALPAITGIVTVNQGLLGTSVWVVDATIKSTAALFATHVSSGVNLTHTSTWTVALSTPTTMWRHVEFINTTDVDIQMSFDGGTTKHRTYPAGSNVALDLKANEMHLTSWISIRNDGTAPSRGKVYVHGTGT